MNVKCEISGESVWITSISPNPVTGTYDIIYVNSLKDVKLLTMTLEEINTTIATGATFIDGDAI